MDDFEEWQYDKVAPWRVRKVLKDEGVTSMEDFARMDLSPFRAVGKGTYKAARFLQADAEGTVMVAAFSNWVNH